MKITINFKLLLISILLTTCFSCEEDNFENGLVGTWEHTSKNLTNIVTFSSDSSGISKKIYASSEKEISFNWYTIKDTLILSVEEMEERMVYTISGNKLTIIELEDNEVTEFIRK